MPSGIVLESLCGMPADLKPIAFLDLDGPILDVAPRHHRVYGDIVTSLGGTPLSLDEFWVAKRHRVPDREILARSGLAEVADYGERKRKVIEDLAYLRLDRLQPDVPEMLRQIGLRYRVVLVTLRQSASALREQLDNLGVDRFFTHILSAPADRRSGWETKLEMVRGAGLTGTPPGFFAGDTETDILAGRALGMATVAVCNGIRDEALLRCVSPDWVIPTLANLSSTELLK